MNEDVKKFLKKLQWEHGITEISNLKENLWWIDDYDKIIKRDEDLYFVSFLPVDDYDQYKWKRTKDSYIKWTCCFKADFDIRAEVQKLENRIMNNEELFSYEDKIRQCLDKDELLKSYNALIFSGNWRHIYRIWKETMIDKDTYSAAATALFDRMKDLFQQAWLPEIVPDYSCSNLSRLMRLPWTMNTKKKYGLDPQYVKLFYYKLDDSDLVSNLKAIWEQAKEKEEVRLLNAKNKMNRKAKRSWIFDNGFYIAINSVIDIADVVMKYTWRTLAENGKNFISNKDWGHVWAYLIPEENIVVWRGTPHFSDYYPVYSPFSFIKIHYADWDTKKTFEKVKELYPELKNQISEFIFHNWLKYGI